MRGGIVESLKKLLSAHRGEEPGRRDGGQAGPVTRVAAPPGKPQRWLQRPKPLVAPEREQQQPTATRGGRHMDEQELSRLRSQFDELQQRLAMLPAHGLTPAREQQLLHKLQSGRPPGSPANEPSAGEVEGPARRHRHSCSAGKEVALLKLSKLSRQRIPSSKALQGRPQREQPVAAADAQAGHAHSRAEKALRKPKVQQVAAARLQSRPGGVEQVGHKVEGQAHRAASPASPAGCYATPIHSQATSPQPLGQTSPSARVPASEHQQAASPPKQSPNPRRASREQLPADLLSLREFATQLQRMQQVQGSRTHSQQEYSVFSRRGSKERGQEEVLGENSAAAPASDATGRLLGTVRSQERSVTTSEPAAHTPTWDSTVADGASSSTPLMATSTHGAGQQQEQHQQQLSLAGTQAFGGAAVQPAAQSADVTPAPRSAARQRAQGSGTSAKSSRPTPAMLRQQAAWGSLAGLTLEEVLATKAPSASAPELQEDQENLPSPQAKSRRTGSPGTAGPLRDSPVSPAALLGQQSRRKTDPAIRAAEEAKPDILHRLQRLHTDGHSDAGLGIKWSRPSGHRLQADTSATSVGSAQHSGVLGSEGSWESAAGPAEQAAADAAYTPHRPGPGAMEQPADSAGAEPGTRRRRGTWNFSAMSAVPEHAALEAAHAADAQLPVGQQQQWQPPGGFAVPWRPQFEDVSGGSNGACGPHQMASLQRSFSAAEPPPGATLLLQQHQQPALTMHRQSRSDGSMFGDASHRQQLVAEANPHTVLPALHSHHSQGWQYARTQPPPTLWAQPAAHGPLLPSFGGYAAAGAQVIMQQQYGLAPSVPPLQHKSSLPPLSRHHMYPY